MTKTWLAAVWGLALMAAPAAATSSYTYGEKGYVTIGNGESPDGRYAIAAHGTGEDASLSFNLYLTKNHGRKVIGPLEEIDDTFETGANAYTASWSPDSKYVALTYRIDRHVVATRLYRIENDRAKYVHLPFLTRDWKVENLPHPDDVTMPSLVQRLTWLDANHIRLREQGNLRAASDDAASAEKLSKLGKPENIEGSTDTLVEFALEAEGVLSPPASFKVTIPPHIVPTP